MRKIFYTVVLVEIFSLCSSAQVTKVWESRINGFYNGLDRIASMYADADGNIISSSNTYNPAFHSDIMTTKHNSAGTLIWSSVYGVPGNSSEGVYAMKIDNSGNVIVTGVNFGALSTDMLILKYDSSGVLQWSDIIDGPANKNDYTADITADQAGNIYVLGYAYVTTTNVDMVLMKYSPLGIRLWIKYFDSGSSLYDQGYKISIAPNDNIILLGYSQINSTDYGTRVISTDTSGTLVWQYYNLGSYNITSMRLDNSGNIFVGGDKAASVSVSDYYIFKLNSSGSFQWQNIYSTSISGTERISSMAVDNAGSVFATGYTYTAGTSFDITTLKYNSSGVMEWVHSYNGAQNNSDQGNDIDLDQFGNVFVTGVSQGGSTGFDAVTIRYNSSGVLQWVERYNGPAGTTDAGEKIKCLQYGSVIVGGRTTGIGTSEDITHIKYSDGALPVTLGEFSGSVTGRNVKLFWKTNEETNNSGFDVERQTVQGIQPANWEKIAFIPGSGTTNEPKQYSFEDKNLNSGKYKYRLKQIDYNSNYEYFNLNSPNELAVGNPGKYELSQNFPNPSNPKSKINFSVPYDSRVSIKVYDMLGREAAILLDGFVTAGYNSVEFDGTNLSSGIYFYKLVSEGLTETKKMMLVK